MSQPAHPAEAESSSAKSHLMANVALLAMMTVLHLAGLGSLILNVTVFVMTKTTRPLLEDPERIGNLVAYVMAGVWVFVGLVAAPASAIGLHLRAPWSRRLAQAYWVMSILTVCCFPVGAYGLYSLSRDEVKRALGG